MTWIIASLPFWICGLGFFCIGLVGIGCTIRDSEKMTDAALHRAALSIVALLISAGVLFLLAAKIAS